MRSWKTSLAGILTIVSAGITLIAVPILDNDAATLPQWDSFLPIALAGIVGLFSRDNNKTSEDVGADIK